MYWAKHHAPVRAQRPPPRAVHHDGRREEEDGRRALAHEDERDAEAVPEVVGRVAGSEEGAEGLERREDLGRAAEREALLEMVDAVLVVVALVAVVLQRLVLLARRLHAARLERRLRRRKRRVRTRLEVVVVQARRDAHAGAQLLEVELVVGVHA